MPSSLADVRAAWLAQLHSTSPADRPPAEEAVRRLYAAAGFPEPRHFLWFDSPCAASWPVVSLIAEANRVWTPLLAPSVLSKESKQRMEHTRAELPNRLGVPDWKAAMPAVGEPRIASLQRMLDPGRTFNTTVVDARFATVDDVSELFVVYGDDDDLARAEQHFWGGNHGVLQSAIHCSTTASVLGNSFFAEYSFSQMADDEHRVAERQSPPFLAAAWDVARSTGMWWPFENAAILCERPEAVHVNERRVPHRDDGPAIVYRDGWRVYAWNGKSVYERWIMDPEHVPPREYKGFDPTYVRWAASKATPATTHKKRAKPGSILSATLPTDPTARLEQLRAAAGGRLPLFERYHAGDHRKVWDELVSLGAAVREDPHAADALAVVYETMQRVESNVRTLVQRLTAMNSVFTPDGPPTGATVLEMGPTGTRIDLDDLMRGMGQSDALAGFPNLSGMFDRLLKARDTMRSHAKPKQDPRPASARAHVPPGPNIRKDIAAFENEFGTLPLSLRVFYEVVGEVNLIGTHRTLDPANTDVAADPLLVYGLDEGIVEYDGDDEEEEGRPSAVTIAPDDLHKANVSGGDSYQVAIPDLRADGELLNERHNLFFVDYLRLCFRFGGFPGYEGRATMPREIETLSAGLLDF